MVYMDGKTPFARKLGRPNCGKQEGINCWHSIVHQEEFIMSVLCVCLCECLSGGGGQGGWVSECEILLSQVDLFKTYFMYWD